MNENRQHIDEFFRDKLFDNEIPAPAEVWNKIDEELKRKKRMFWLKFSISMAASIALIFSTGIGYYFGLHKNLVVSNQRQQSIVVNKLANSAFVASGKNNLKKDNQISFQNSGENKKDVLITNFNSNKVKEVKSEKFRPTNDSMVRMALLPHKDFSIRQAKNLQLLLMYSDKTISDYLENNEVATTVNEEIERPANKESNWLLGGNFAPNYSYRNIQSNSTAVQTSYLNNVEQPILAYSGGLNLNYAAKRWRFESGLYYTQAGQKYVYPQEEDLVKTSTGTTFQIVNNNEIITSNGVIKVSKNLTTSSNFPNTTNSSSTFSELEQKYGFIEIPFIAHYKIIDKKTDVAIAGGMSTDILVKNNVYSGSNNSFSANVGSTINTANVSYVGIFGVSIEIPVFTRINLLFEPRLRYFLNSINNEGSINTHPYSLGVYTGISYKF